jgi:hypothetical protein
MTESSNAPGSMTVEIKESKEFEKAEKVVGGLTAKSIVEKTPEQLKEFISVTSAFLLTEKQKCEAQPAMKAAKDVIKEKNKELKEDTKEQDALLKLAILVYSKRI